MQRFEYRGFCFLILPEFESPEERIARGDWQSRLLGYRLNIRYRGRLLGDERTGFSTIEEARTWGENEVDAILDSL